MIMPMKNLLLYVAIAMILQSCLRDEYDIDMVFVEGGEFVMGCDMPYADPDERPVHNVVVDDFYIGRYEVTQAQWNAVMPIKSMSCFEGGCNPVECVSWYEIEVFIRKLNKKTGHKYRLPTEKEWEYAARGGKYMDTYSYSGSDSIDCVGWYIETSDSTTHCVGLLQPNSLGIYDMTGNVHEWCATRYDSLSYGHPDSICERRSDDLMVFRGGSWRSDSLHCRVANRNHISAEIRNFTLGFRLAEDAD